MSLLFVAIAALIGVWLGRLAWGADLIGCDFPGWLWLAPLVALPFTPLLNRLRPTVAPLHWPASSGFRAPQTGVPWGLVAACGLALLLGAFRYASHPFTPCFTPDDLAYYNLPADRAFDRGAPTSVVTGYVASYPMVSDARQRMNVEAQTIEVNGSVQPVQGLLTLNTGIRRRYSYGNLVRLEGRLAAPPEFEDFSYADYLARSNVFSVMNSPAIQPLSAPPQGSALLRWLYTVRANGEELINRSLPEPYAALANGMLLGIEAGIPDELYDKFNATGSSHVIVISGSNVALIAGVLIALGYRFFGRKHAVWPALLGIAAYALLVGGDAAVMRASVMGSLAVIAAALGRRNTAIISLAIACWLMALANPLTLWDVGFQLSSAATAGLMLFTPALTAIALRLFPRWQGGALTASVPEMRGMGRAMSGFLQDGLIVTIAATIATLPLILTYFGRLSLVSLLTNLLIVPVQPLIMLSGTGALVVGLSIAALVAQPIFWLTWLGLAWTVGVVETTAALPWASVEIVGYGWGAAILTYAVIFGLLWRSQLSDSWLRVRNYAIFDWQRRVLGPTAVGSLCIAAALIWVVNRSLPDGRLHIHFLNIGQGDGIFIETPSGRQMLIDGGKSPELLFGELGAVMPFWDRSIDLVAMTHPDADHMEAQVYLPSRFAVTTAIETAASRANPDADAWRANFSGAGTDIQLQHAGGWIDLGDGVALWVLWPSAEGYGGENADNENSLVLKLVYGDFSVLLTGDAGLPAESGMMDAGAPLPSTVLKVGHHGSNGSSGEAFLRQVDPLTAVIQVGEDNDYGHPHPEVLARLAGRAVLRNDLQGRIHIASDGRQMWVESEQGAAGLTVPWADE
jgi:competence protein ComEC